MKDEIKLHPSTDRILNDPNLPKFVQRSKEWYDYRKTRVTASEVSTVLACGRGAKSLMHRKKFKFHHAVNESESQTQSQTQNEYLKLGLENESIVVDLYGKKFPHVTVYHDLSIVPHRCLDYVAASLDACTNTGINVEIKTSFKTKFTTVPKSYYDQVQLQMEVAELELTHLVYHYVRIPGQPIQIHSIARDRKWFEVHGPTLAKFVEDLRKYFPFDLERIQRAYKMRYSSSSPSSSSLSTSSPSSLSTSSLPCPCTSLSTSTRPFDDPNLR